MEEEIKKENEERDAIDHKNSSLKRLDESFIKHIEMKEYKKSNILAHWIKDFAEYHDNEKSFKPSSLKRFKRGDVVKANLGFNIGNELGGLHYCVVTNKKDNLSSGLLNVVPLSSSKENKKYNSSTCIDLGDELYNSLKKRIDLEFTRLNNEILENCTYTEISNKKEIISKKMDILEKMRIELDGMKHGSIALVHQFRIISKQRIYRSSLLSKIRLSNESLDLIDKKIKELFTK